MKVLSIQPTTEQSQLKPNFKGLWGDITESKHLGSETIYGGEVTVDRYEKTQEYFPFADETKEMTATALDNHSYIESTNANFTFCESSTIIPKIMPKLKFTAQEFIDYVGNHLGKEFKVDSMEKMLKEANLTKYLRHIK